MDGVEGFLQAERGYSGDRSQKLCIQKTSKSKADTREEESGEPVGSSQCLRRSSAKDLAAAASRGAELQLRHSSPHWSLAPPADAPPTCSRCGQGSKFTKYKYTKGGKVYCVAGALQILRVPLVLMLVALRFAISSLV